MDSLFLRLFLISSQKEAMVVDILSNSNHDPLWNLLFSRDLYDWEALLVTTLLDSFNDIFLSRSSVDKRVWTLESFGMFSSKSFSNPLSSPLNPDSSFPHWMIWKPDASPRVKAFSWTAVLGQINTIDMLQKRSFMHLSPHWCFHCHEDGESVHHIFLHCSLTTKIWSYFLSRMGLKWVMPKKVTHLFSSWHWYSVSTKSKMFGECLLHTIVWSILKERNNRIFLQHFEELRRGN